MTFKPPYPSSEMVAVLAGVTRPVVSYYFEGQTNRFSPKTEIKIREAAKRIGYYPYVNDDWYDTNGRALVRSRGNEATRDFWKSRGGL